MPASIFFNLPDRILFKGGLQYPGSRLGILEPANQVRLIMGKENGFFIYLTEEGTIMREAVEKSRWKTTPMVLNDRVNSCIVSRSGLKVFSRP